MKLSEYLKKKSKKKSGLRIILSILLILSIVYIINGLNNELVLTEYTIKTEKLPNEFEGYCIVQLSDFHCKEFGDKEDILIDMVRGCEPDMILFTGDFIDEDHDSIDNVEYLLQGISDLCTIYQINGNHERDDRKLYDDLNKLYDMYDVVNLNDCGKQVVLGDEQIVLQGVDFKSNYFLTRGDFKNDNTEKFSILVYHNAALFDETSTYGYDLVLGGHTHGGIIRLPIIGGLFDNDKLIPAKYESGVYYKNDSILVSSRGLGDADLPRFYNEPEVIKIILEKD